MRSLLLVVLLLCGASAAAGAQTPAEAALPSLTFFGLRAGSTLSATAAQIRRLHGSRLVCRPARADPSVNECQASIPDPSQPDSVAILDVWLSAVDSLVAVMTVAGPVSQGQLRLWREALVTTFGPVPAELSARQRMFQWIRHRQMLRLTWRGRDDSTVASVSLVDGPILDGWGRRRAEQERIRGLP